MSSIANAMASTNGYSCGQDTVWHLVEQLPYFLFLLVFYSSYSSKALILMFRGWNPKPLKYRSRTLRNLSFELVVFYEQLPFEERLFSKCLNIFYFLVYLFQKLSITCNNFQIGFHSVEYTTCLMIKNIFFIWFFFQSVL